MVQGYICILLILHSAEIIPLQVMHNFHCTMFLTRLLKTEELTYTLKNKCFVYNTWLLTTSTM